MNTEPSAIISTLGGTPILKVHRALCFPALILLQNHFRNSMLRRMRNREMRTRRACLFVEFPRASVK
jgi:hypothetical protein